MTKQLPKHLVSKIYRMNELVYRAQALQEEIEQWIAANTEADESEAFELVTDYSNGCADSVEADALIAAISEIR